MDASNEKIISAKITALKEAEITQLKGNVYLSSNEHRILAVDNDDTSSLNIYADIAHGQSAGDNSLFNRFFGKWTN